MKMKKMYLRQLNLRNFEEIQESKKLEKTKFIKLHIMNLKIL